VSVERPIVIARMYISAKEGLDGLVWHHIPPLPQYPLEFDNYYPDPEVMCSVWKISRARQALHWIPAEKRKRGSPRITWRQQ